MPTEEGLLRKLDHDEVLPVVLLDSETLEEGLIELTLSNQQHVEQLVEQVRQQDEKLRQQAELHNQWTRQQMDMVKLRAELSRQLTEDLRDQVEEFNNRMSQITQDMTALKGGEQPFS